MSEAARSEWLEKRRAVIGGTDIAAIVGCSRWKSAMDVYCDKLGLVEADAESEQMRWGKALEPVVAARYAEEHGVELAEPGFLRHPQREWWGGTPDRIVKGAPVGLEIKTAGWRTADEWGESGTDAVPEQYLMQCAWYAPLLNVERMDLAVLVAGQDYREYTIPRDPELEGLLEETAAKFWTDHILKQAPPRLDGSEGCRRYLESRYPKSSATLIKADAAAETIIAALRDARMARISAEQLEATLEAQIKELIGENAGVESELGKLTWRLSNGRKSLDIAALKADPEAAALIVKYTRQSAGSRRFCVPRSWGSNHTSEEG